MLKNDKGRVPDVRQRAAEIRGHWTVSERRRREGLPPDIPEKLRNYLMNWRSADSESRSMAM
jgi:hypothetical protein